MLNVNAKWIWISDNWEKNEYVVFDEKFFFDGGKAVFTIAAETDYVLYVNGEFAAFGQFAGYPFEKYCDELDITKHCRNGENVFNVTVRYEGVNSSTHIDDGAGVIFSLDIDGKSVLYSGRDTMCGYDGRYIQHQARCITKQLGLTSGMRSRGYVINSQCVEIDKTYNIKPRPVKKTVLQAYVEAKPVEGKPDIYDLGRETAGYICAKIKADKSGMVTIGYGEHLTDGCVRRIIDYRDFSLDFEVTEGVHEFKNFFLRVACRYLQPELPEGAEIVSIGIIPVLYPITEKGHNFEGLDGKIYDTCVRTLRLCMNLHYEDCPWREQALYILDSRNQILCGYYAFEETDFARENLKLMSKGIRDDGFFELTYPAVKTPAVPFFSLMYPVTVLEYTERTGDMSVLDEAFDVICNVMNNFNAKVDKRGLIKSFENPYWNFYEWSEGSADEIPEPGKFVEYDYYHLLLNCAFVYSTAYYKKLCELKGKMCDMKADIVKDAIVKEFYDESTGLFTLRTDDKSLSSQLGNAFALLIGLGDERTLEAVKYSKNCIPATLSMLAFVYDALLAADYSNKDFIIDDIRKKYGYMLDQGATSFWETILGDADFENAGSLCHGWSALPIYYYNILLDGN